MQGCWRMQQLKAAVQIFNTKVLTQSKEPDAVLKWLPLYPKYTGQPPSASTAWFRRAEMLSEYNHCTITQWCLL